MIYKYLPSSPESLELLRSAEIKFVHSSTTCDPFDFAPVIIDGAPKKQEEERFTAALSAWGFDDPEEAEPHQEYFEEIEEYQPSFPNLISKTFYSSFCLRPDNPVMWTRSACGMTGFCVGCKEEALIGEGRAQRFIKVDYQDDRPIVDAFLYALALDQYNFHKSMMPEEEVIGESWATMEAIWAAAFATKSRDWVAEQEARLLIHDTEDTYEDSQEPSIRCPDSGVVELILGEEMAVQLRERLIATAKSAFANVRVFEARASKTEYVISVAELPTLVSTTLTDEPVRTPQLGNDN
uniref:hypothetical protein n=1 Tax=Parerythrobacter lutipelagi TaxID=1964208 RepID=UPI0010F59056|nr:hypothetical protein [Parerythrobacter lutipelagi]